MAGVKTKAGSGNPGRRSSYKSPEPPLRRGSWGGSSTLSPTRRRPKSVASDSGPGRPPTGGDTASSSLPPEGDSAAGTIDEGRVRVAVRVRPLNEQEQARGGERVVRCRNPKVLELMGAAEGEGRVYTFDLCAHEGFSQGDMFQACGLLPLLNAAVDGYACTVFAYGATGAGKTYTMSGPAQAAGESEDTRQDELSDGLIPNSMKHLFSRIAGLPEGVQLRIRASYCEIYNEQVFDLLNIQKEPLQVRYDAKCGFFVQGLFEVQIRGLEDIMVVVEEGNSNRRVAPHLLNQDSSRSHSLLTMYLQSEWKDAEDGHLVKKFGKVVFVDLAGSERLKKTHTRDEKETASINKSLMTLGKVISALSKQGGGGGGGSGGGGLSPPRTQDGTPQPPSTSTAPAPAPAEQSTWVPYRDSTLTKLLMDSLGGNGLTLMVACVSPSAEFTEETVSTLNYAARARNIKNKPLVQLDPRERVIAALRREVKLLRMENALLRGSLQRGPPGGGRDLYNLGKATNELRIGGGGGGGGGGGVAQIDGPGENRTSSTAAADSRAGTSSSRQSTSPDAGVALQEAVEDADEVDLGSFSPPKTAQEVGKLLAKYEEECHRLRKEAARAVQKEQHMSQQFRQALEEHEALSRTVDRLQKAFNDREASAPGLMSAPPSEATFKVPTLVAPESRGGDQPRGSDKSPDLKAAAAGRAKPLEVASHRVPKGLEKA